MVLYKKNKIWDVADSFLYFEIVIRSFFQKWWLHFHHLEIYPNVFVPYD